MKNKLYQVQGVNAEYCNIVSAPNAKQAKLIGANKEWTEDVDFLDLRVSAIKGGLSWYQEEPEIYFNIKGKGFIYTDIKSGLLYWKEFIYSIIKTNGVDIDFGSTFVNFIEDAEICNYYGLHENEFKEILSKTNKEYPDFEDFSKEYGINLSKITFQNVEDFLEGLINLPILKRITNWWFTKTNWKIRKRYNHDGNN